MTEMNLTDFQIMYPRCYIVESFLFLFSSSRLPHYLNTRIRLRTLEPMTLEKVCMPV